MHREHSVTLCLPCRNEGAHLRLVLERVPDLIDEVIVISNRSTDDTVEVAKSAGARAIVDDRAVRGIGYGYAHLSGLDNASGDLVVAADGDATYPIERAGSVLDFLLDRQLDVVSCARYPVQADTSIPWRLRLGVQLLNAEVRLLYGARVNDILSGMWVLRASAIEPLALSMGDWNLSPQIKLNAIRHPDLRFAEFPISQFQREGQSHQRHFSTGLSHLWWIGLNRFRTPWPDRR